MADKQMPKVDLSKDSGLLHKAVVNYMDIIQKHNLQRVEKLQKIKRNNRITGAALGFIATGIYVYSIAAVKQETFLDDFEEPELVPKSDN